MRLASRDSKDSVPSKNNNVQGRAIFEVKQDRADEGEVVTPSLNPQQQYSPSRFQANVANMADTNKSNKRRIVTDIVSHTESARELHNQNM